MNYLQNINFDWLSIGLEYNYEQFANEAFEYRIVFNSDIKELPAGVTIEWIPPENSDNLQVLYPLQIVSSEQNKLRLHFINHYSFSIWFRVLKEGTQKLGVIKISSDDNSYYREISLEEINVKSKLFPVYQVHPNKEVAECLEKELLNDVHNCIAYTITGFGGVGKTFLINDILVKAANNSYICFDVACPQVIINNSFLWTKLLLDICRFFNSNFIYEDKILEYCKTILGIYYDEIWEADITAFLTGNSYNISFIIEFFVSIFLRVSQNKNVLIWISDTHWISEESGELLRKIISVLKTNKMFLLHKILFVIEGRKDEMLLFDNKFYYPFAWENFLLKAEVNKLEMNLWGKEDCRKLINSLICKNNNEEIDDKYKNELVRYLLSYSNGTPMHILEQLRYLIQCEKLALRKDGTIYIVNTNWNSLFSNDITKLISLRISFYREKYANLIDYLIIVANLSEFITPVVAEYLLKIIKKKYPNFESFIVEIGLGEVKRNTITFLHEYYVVCLRKLSIDDPEIVHMVFEWLSKKADIDIKIALCCIQVGFLQDHIDYHFLCKKIISCLENLVSPNIKKNLYEYLSRIPESVLNQYEYKLYVVYFDLAQIIIQSGNWIYAKEYLHKIVSEFELKDCDYFYYKALAYQDLSNISSGQLLMDEAINFAETGLESIKTALSIYGESCENLKRAQELLLERLAICQLFSGDLKVALATQNEAFNSAVTRGDAYMKLRIDYERGGTYLHTDIDNGISILHDKYIESLKFEMLYEEEWALIHTMELVGKLLRAQNDKGDLLHTIYEECMKLEYSIQDKGYNYTASINLQTAACALLLDTGDILSALPIFIKSLEKALDANLDELLWKCYINLAQCYHKLGEHEKAIYYGYKCAEIINQMMLYNPVNRHNLEKLFMLPILRLHKIIPEETIYCRSNDTDIHVHHIRWDENIFFIMN